MAGSRKNLNNALPAGHRCKTSRARERFAGGPGFASQATIAQRSPFGARSYHAASSRSHSPLRQQLTTFRVRLGNSKSIIELGWKGLKRGNLSAEQRNDLELARLKELPAADVSSNPRSYPLDIFDLSRWKMLMKQFRSASKYASGAPPRTQSCYGSASDSHVAKKRKGGLLRNWPELRQVVGQSSSPALITKAGEPGWYLMSAFIPILVTGTR